MNSLKTLFVSAVLVAVLYGVYLAMNRGPEPEPPLEVAEAWNQSMQDGDMGGGLNIEPGTQMRAPTVLHDQVGGAVPVTTPPADTANAKSAVSAPKMTMNFNVPDGGPGGPAMPKPAKATDNRAHALNAPPKAAGLAANPNTPLKSAVTPAVQPATKSFSPVGDTGFTELMSNVRGELARNRLLDAYRMLSSRYRDPKFAPAENVQIEHLLDQLAGTIVYSKEHFIERPHLVGPNETLEQIAQRYNVPPQLLAKINGLTPAQPLQPGSQLKVVRGPFSAEIDLAKHELTLRLPDGGYAGRFTVGVGRDVPQIKKSYRIYDKKEMPPGPAVAPGVASSGPLGKQKWIGLEGRLGIHAASHPSEVGRSGGQGGITLRARDVDDLYDILSVGSQIVIRR